MNNNLLSIRLNWNLSANPDTFTVTDISNYVGTTSSNKLGNLKLISPSGNVIHNNTSYGSPDINFNSSHTSAAFALTTVAVGTYTAIYTVKLEDELQINLIVANTAHTLDLVGDLTALILDSTATAFQCVDSTTTSLTVTAATYSSTTGLTTVTFSETLGALTNLATFTFTVDTIATKTFSQAYTYVTPDVCLSWEEDECCSSMTITDVTTYPDGATPTRLHTLHYPDGMLSPIADVESPLQEFTSTPIWTGTYTDTFTASFDVTQGIIVVSDSIRGVKEFTVTSDTNSCQIYACYKNVVNKYADQLRTAPTAAMVTGQWLNLATGVLGAYNLAKKCGKPQSEIDTFLAQITDIANTCGCSCDCADCADGTPVQVVGCCGDVAGSDFTVVITSDDGSINISLVTVGSTSTFHIEVNGTWLTTQIDNEIALTSIGDLVDVDTTSTAPVTNQVLRWNGTKWVPGTSVTTLVGLTDVDNSGLANNMFLYWNSGTSRFKFKLVTCSIAASTDVLLTSLTDKDKLRYDGSLGVLKWANIADTLDNIANVNATGKIANSSIKWDTGTSKWIIFQPKLNLSELDDVNFGTPPALWDVLSFNGTDWVDVHRPVFNSVSGGDFNAGVFDNSAGYPVQLRSDTINGSVTLRGTADNLGGLSAAAVTIFTISNAALRPTHDTPIMFMVGIPTAASTIAGGTIYSATGIVEVGWYVLAATGVVTAGCPAGKINFDNVCPWYTI